MSLLFNCVIAFGIYSVHEIAPPPPPLSLPSTTNDPTLQQPSPLYSGRIVLFDQDYAEVGISQVVLVLCAIT